MILGALLILSLGVGWLEVAATLQSDSVSESAIRIWHLVFVILSVMWVYADSKKQEFERPFEFGFIVYVLWPIVFPWYLVTTRGLEGIVLFLGFLAIWLGPWLSGLVAYEYFM
ncbi:MAG: hypothetical protein H6953_15095 [Chromatiaceae bacterium]|nr:hypothetical protein [Chromatiaceae bacterium]MCP5306769.1 hypothetical protein [Chromatiaceae bacterium]MCP5421730.1 hypothetical protein [Chromatiaceae bacterium]MCP5421732.1 hypothetical protein [Chromatiaceae bacterium]